MSRPFPFDMEVCSLSQMRRRVRRIDATHVVSLVEAKARVYTPSRVSVNDHLILRFEDDEDPSAPFAPEPRHVKSLLDFGKRVPEGARVVVHCRAGVSRSSAGAIALLAQAGGPEMYEEAVRAVMENRPEACPNRLVVELADDRLGADGALSAAVEPVVERRLREMGLGPPGRRP